MSESIANVDIPEIEITPEMIEAGVKIFMAFDSRFDGEEEAVESIYRAMNCIHGKMF